MKAKKDKPEEIVHLERTQSKEAPKGDHNVIPAPAGNPKGHDKQTSKKGGNLGHCPNMWKPSSIKDVTG